MARIITSEEVAQHKTSNDLWFIVHGKVYDATKFLNNHPGGEEVLLDFAGRDATDGFEDVGHSEEARKQLEEYYIGDLKAEPVKAKKSTAVQKEGGIPLIVMIPILLVLFFAARFFGIL
eukprot:TRINITY_DN14807_c0_g1::TRINITY_DN14807_c0_g1_i1::g.30234::m.30234 TRINITY_DN14807_c0_g1::TRINITY_DN14807_c0_g1_i1::g.30234  ORF type:complete len:134 (-),score=45.93,sp/Q9ZWT2/CYB5D_ARATH/45.16/2e-31,Cyt-b5/PF00173.23/8.4e-28 TRINITY_DN14807_c0_g1_i1:569-925(-)